MLGTGPLLGQALQNSWDRPALGTGLRMLGTGPLLGQALQNAWDMPVLGTGPSKSLGQALRNAWDRPAIGTGQSKCLGQALQNDWRVGIVFFLGNGIMLKKQDLLIGDCWGVQAGRWWWWSWVVVGNWGWMVGGSRWFVVDSVWVISFIEVLIRRAQKSLEIRAKYVARKIARFDAGVVVANALSDRCWFSCMSQE